MNKHMLQRAPQIAREFIGTWNAHRSALDEVPLHYLEHLIDAALQDQPMKMWELQSRLYPMIPTATPGTIARMLHLKFGHTDGEILEASATR